MKKILFVGMDVHKDTISNAVLNGHDNVPELEIKLPNREKSVLESFSTN
ncbi:MAG: hypothetical protein J7K04_06920 [Spirochaetales bacterium]|nr:hypothetical protein [Spirochaetales bacterium]